MTGKHRCFGIALTVALLGALAGCSQSGKSTIEQAPFGQTAEGMPVVLYTLENDNGMKVALMNYGGIVVSLHAPDQGGNFEDVVLGHDTLEGYLDGHPYFGALVGRYANRIDEGRFVLDGKTYQLATNDGPNHLHGGEVGFDKRVWASEPVREDGDVGVQLSYTSPHGEEGYPSNLHAVVTYWLTEENELRIEYEARSDGPTICNLTHHSYFNLAGHDAGTILAHDLMINADEFTPVDETLIPTGELRPVKGTPFDFRQPTAIGARIGQENRQLTYGRGYDHNWVLDRTSRDGLALAARVHERKSGRVLEVWTTEPGLQFYCGNFLDGTDVGKGGHVYEYRNGFCLEAQHFPDSPNHSHFPSTVLRPGETYTQTTVYRFTVADAED